MKLTHSSKKHSRRFYIIFVLLTLIIILGIGFILLPRPSAWYYVSILDKIGAPKGFVITHTPNDSEVEYGIIGSNPEVRRTYSGNSSAALQSEMLNRVRGAGFQNAQWRDKAAGIIGYCKNTSVFVSFDDGGNVPIDIEVDQSDYPNAPSCPWLLPHFAAETG
jgi:hypothetical protein